MKQIHKRSDSIMYYDTEQNIFIKEYTPHKWYSKRGIRTLLGIMKTPGRHVDQIYTILTSHGIPCPELVAADNYQVVTKSIVAYTVESYRKIYGEFLLRDELIELLLKLLHAGVVHRDANQRNFLFDGTTLFVIDLDGLEASPFRFLPKQKLLYYIWESMDFDDDFCQRLMEGWPERTLLQKGMDAIYTIRSFFLRLMGKGKKEEQDFVTRMHL